MNAQALALALGGTKHGRGWRCLCPAHDDHDPSLDIEDGKTEVVLKCRVGCTQEAVIGALVGRGLWDREAPKSKTEIKPNGGGRTWTLVSEHIYYTADGQPYLRVRKKLDENGKKQYPQAHWNGHSWVGGAPKGSKVPYRLPQLLAGPLDATVYFCEGEKDAEALANLNFIATTACGGASAPWDDALTPLFRDRNVVILPDADKPGRAHGRKVAAALTSAAASVRLVDLYPDRHDGSDVSDWLAEDPAGAKLARQARNAPSWQPDALDRPVGGDEELIAELAALPTLGYERRRDAVAERLGVRVTSLDRLVAKARGGVDRGRDAKGAPSALYAWWEVEPSDAPVDGTTVLTGIVDAIRRYVFLSEDQAVAAALWVMFTWCHDAMAHSPILFVTSAEPDSGKTTLLGVLSFLVRRGMPNVEISGAALFRSIRKWQPCFIVDEADDAFGSNPDLRSVVNSGWTRGSGVVRCHPETHEPELFPTFAPKCIGMKGRGLPSTTLSRSIVITMKPRRATDPAEAIEDFDHLDQPLFADLRARACRWAADHAEALAKAQPEVPPGFHNRRRANWKTLLAIAQQVGGQWKQFAQQAARAIEAVHDEFERSIGVELLSAIRDIFERKAVQQISSKSLAEELVEDQTGPWVAFGKSQKPITQNGIARLLKPFEVAPRTVRFGEDTQKGYALKWFKDAFERHLPPLAGMAGEQAVTPSQDRDINGLDEIPSVTSGAGVTDSSQANRLKDNGCDGVTGQDERTARGYTGADRRCAQCGAEPDGTEQECSVAGDTMWLHRRCQQQFLDNARSSGCG